MSLHEPVRILEALLSKSPRLRQIVSIVMEIRKTDKAVSDILDGPLVQHSELASKIQDLHIFFSLLIPDMSHEEKQLLDEALIITYNRKGITHENQSLIDPENPGRYRAMPILGDVYEVLMEKAETKRLANILNRMVYGSASSFNQQTNVDLSNQYVVLDISELSGDLLTVGMFVALDFVWSNAKEDRTDMLLRLLESDGRIKGNLFALDDIYERIYFIPLMKEAQIQVRLMMNPEEDRRLRDFLCTELWKINGADGALDDGVDRDGNHLLF